MIRNAAVLLVRAGILVTQVMLATGCARDKSTGPDDESSVGELSGEVFIVTQGGPSIKLGLVTVVAIPEADIEAHIQRKRDEAAAASTQLKANMEAAYAAVAAARRAVTQADKEVDVAARLAHQEYMACLGTAATRGECSAAKPTYEQIKHDLLWQRKQEVRARESEVAKLKAEQDFLASSEFYMADLPAGVATAKTNADGLFTMRLPRNARVALAARGSRQVFGDVENYHWLVWATLDGAFDKRIMLSNDNMTTAGSSESVIALKQ
jgi:hypothetical protein